VGLYRVLVRVTVRRQLTPCGGKLSVVEGDTRLGRGVAST